MSNESLLEVTAADTAEVKTDEATPETLDTNIVAAKPENLPDDFWDAEKQSYKGEDLFKAYESEKAKALGLRQKLSKGDQNAPKDVDGYKLEWDDEENPLDDSNPQVSVFKKIAHENNLNQEQFNGMLKSFQKEFKAGSFDPNEELSEAETQQWRQEEMKRLGANHKQITDGFRSWSRQYVQTGVLTQEESERLLKMPASAEDLKILTKIKESAGFINDIPLGGVSVDGGHTREQIDALIASPDYYDETKGAHSRKVVEDYFKKMHP